MAPTTTNRSYGKILVTTDLSDISEAAFRYACFEARKSGARLTLLNVFDELVVPINFYDKMPTPEFVEAIRKKSLENVRSKVDQVVKKNFSGTEISIEILDTIKPPPDAIVQYAQEGKFDLIVLASHGRGFFGRMIIGSVAERVLARANCPVLIVPSGPDAKSPSELSYREIVVPTDFSDASKAAFSAAAYEAEISGAAIRLIYVTEAFAPNLVPPMEGVPSVDLQKIQEGYRAKSLEKLKEISKTYFNGKARTEIVDKTFSVPNAIVEYGSSINADLIVMSRLGANKPALVLGSVSERVIHQMRCPVMIVPAHS